MAPFDGGGLADSRVVPFRRPTRSPRSVVDWRINVSAESPVFSRRQHGDDQARAALRVN